ncbi:MAG: ferredoxin [Thermoplasmata archaeon]|nr:MAG: ferredoxin [Thermoplasmata archaeon]HDO69650.1 4Fe-4S dicluster domain-containing protein [Thermoplasmatales archaeon]HEX17565.1 4Fe-4S dicluster domain-containing protein [Thermoplasmatales archaeon]
MGKTGSWRVFKPVLDKEKCVRCLRCWIFCPEGAIKRLDDDSVEIDYDYCKGCGICARECKVKAIVMEREG